MLQHISQKNSATCSVGDASNKQQEDSSDGHLPKGEYIKACKIAHNGKIVRLMLDAHSLRFLKNDCHAKVL